LPSQISGKIHVIGNPPFGRQSSLCHKFIRHASIFADTISFILPVSFKKRYNISRIPSYYHLTTEVLLDRDSFIHNGSNFSIPTVFQIWQKKESKRVSFLKQIPIGFSFVKKSQACFSICRCGNAGFATTLFEHKSEGHNFFIKLLVNSNVDHVVALVNETRIVERNFNVGPASISKQEIIPYLNAIINL
jgi:hypothetical protein